MEDCDCKAIVKEGRSWSFVDPSCGLEVTWFPGLDVLELKQSMLVCGDSEQIVLPKGARERLRCLLNCQAKDE